MLSIWKELGVFEISEQRLADQARAIRTNRWLSEIELEEIQRNTESDHVEADVRESSGSEDTARRIELETTDETVKSMKQQLKLITVLAMSYLCKIFVIR